MSACVNFLLNRLYITKSLCFHLKNIKSCRFQIFAQQQMNYANNVTVTASPLSIQEESIKKSPMIKERKVSKAMKAYLERAREHDEFMKRETEEYKIGKRHLANMMGEDPETFTQEDVENAIQYLFPSGLFDKKARPIMKPPEEIFPARKAAEFDETGRPFHSMFYTGRANFFKLLHDIVEEMNELNDFEDRMIRKGNKPDPNLKIEQTGYQWLQKDHLELLLVERIADIEYNNFVNAMNRLLSLSYSYKSKEFIDKYRRPLLHQSNAADIPKPQYDENGKMYITTYECLRKRARADVTLRMPGTGQILINGKDITYFEDLQPREQILFPLIFTNMLGKCDIEANVAGGGPSGQAGAIRWGISMCLRSFVDQELMEQMRLAGLLQRDYRRRERKKPGQAGARRKYTWKKR